jgi:4-hydroxybenzoate polyprenyltransferase
MHLQEDAAMSEATSIRWPRLRLLRPKQWVKNGFLLAPLVFATKFRDPDAWILSLSALGLFCLGSSVVYILNDLLDAASDREHPVKRVTRPIAAGAISPAQAWCMLVILEAIALSAAWCMTDVVLVLIAYQMVNVFYSAKLKHVAIVDLFCVAGGFVLRVYAGAVAIHVPLSAWMLNTTWCLALYMATIKRRQELRSQGDQARAVLKQYSVELLDHLSLIAAVCAIAFYGLFTLTVRPELGMTVPLVLAGFYRYQYMVTRHEGGESPTDLIWQDLPLILIVLSWIGLSVFALMQQTPA